MASLVHIECRVDYTSQQEFASAVVRVEPPQTEDKIVEGDNLHGSDPDLPCVAVIGGPVDKDLRTGCSLACLWGVGAWK